MTLEEARVIAEKELNCSGERVITRIKETDELWIFWAGIPGLKSYGGKNSICIYKDSGRIELFRLPDKKNFEILRSAKDIYIKE